MVKWRRPGTPESEAVREQEAQRKKEKRAKREQRAREGLAEMVAARVDNAVKTSLKLDRALWKAAHMRAMDDGTDLQTVVARALEAYLKGGSK